MEKLSFYLSLLRFSLFHPKRGLDLINEVNQVHDDAKQEVKKFEFEPVKFSDALNLIFGKKEEIKDDFSKISDLEEHLKHFFENISAEYPSAEKPYPVDYSIMGESGPFLYELCKFMKPELIVETGVAYGVSSSYILKALDENNKGKLISIDSIFRPWQSEKMIGSVIPNSIKSRWQLCVGSSNEQLTMIYQKYSEIDLFLHDSLHTYQNMMFEFKKSWPNIKTGGFLLSDDILGNNAFYDFYKMINKTPSLLFQKVEPISLMGIIVK